MANVFVFFADGMEEIEAITPVDLLRRAGNPVTTVSITGEKLIRGAHGIMIEADALFEKTDFSGGDLFVLPGGGEGTQNLAAHAALGDLLTEKEKERKHIAALCAAPSVLAKLGLLDGKKATIYPTVTDELQGATYVDIPAITDGRITTGHGPGAAVEFALELVRVMNGALAAEELRKQIVFQH